MSNPKQLPSRSVEDDLPPPYTAAATSDNGLFTSHLRALYSPAQTAETSDGLILASLVDPIDSFLASIAGIRPVPKQVEAAFVPEDVMGPGWMHSDGGDRHKGEVARVVRVGRNTKGYSDGKGRKERPSENQASSSDKGFTDWGRYDDEVSFDEPDPETSLWFSDEELAHRLARRLEPATREANPGRMTLGAEEITFRGENEMGIWETKTGWAIVVRVLLQ